LEWLRQLGKWIQTFLIPLGGWGLAPIAFFDSSFLSLAGGVDLLLVTLAIANPSGAFLYALAATIGSVSGATVLNLTVRAGSQAIVAKSASSKSVQHARTNLERYGAWAVMIAALLPPPAPFKLFVVTSGFLAQPLGRFILGLTAGRLIRYSLVAFFAARYGSQVWDWILRAGPWVFALVLFTAIVTVLWQQVAKRQRSAK
jgi:membrane protein YqaA with SNARE-associated domain